MGNDNLAAELTALRAQLERLEQERRQSESAAATDPPPADSATAAGIPADIRDWLEQEGIDLEGLSEKISGGLRDWLEALHEDLKDANPSTLLLVFALGVALGRLTR